MEIQHDLLGHVSWTVARVVIMDSGLVGTGLLMIIVKLLSQQVDGNPG